MGKSAYLVDNADELEKDWFNAGSKIGVTAGASAPEISSSGSFSGYRIRGATLRKNFKGERKKYYV